MSKYNYAVAITKASNGDLQAEVITIKGGLFSASASRKLRTHEALFILPTKEEAVNMANTMGREFTLVRDILQEEEER